MTELEMLLNEWWKIRPSKNGMTPEQQIVESAKLLNQKYSVSLRNTVSTAVNQKDDNLVDEKQLVDKIAKIVFQAKENVKSQSFQISCNNFAEEIVKIFKTYQNSVLRQANKQDDNLLSQEDLLSKMDSLIWDFANDFTCCNQDQEFYFVEDFKSELIKLFTSYLNPVFRALNDSDEQSIIK